MNISTNTVKTFLRLIMIKMGVSSRMAVVRKLSRLSHRGLPPLSPVVLGLTHLGDDSTGKLRHHPRMMREQHSERRHSSTISCAALNCGARSWRTRNSRRVPKTAIRGRIQNLSQGGVCLLSNGRFQSHLSSVVKLFFRTRTAIPRSCRFRWTQRNFASGRSKIGLQFLL